MNCEFVFLYTSYSRFPFLCFWGSHLDKSVKRRAKIKIKNHVKSTPKTILVTYMLKLFTSIKLHTMQKKINNGCIIKTI